MISLLSIQTHTRTYILSLSFSLHYFSLFLFSLSFSLLPPSPAANSQSPFTPFLDFPALPAAHIYSFHLSSFVPRFPSIRFILKTVVLSPLV